MSTDVDVTEQQEPQKAPIVKKKAAANGGKPAAAKKPTEKKSKPAKKVVGKKPEKAERNGAHGLAERLARRKELPIDAKVVYRGRRGDFAGKAGVVVGHESGKSVAGVYVKIGDERFVCSAFSLEKK